MKKTENSLLCVLATKQNSLIYNFSEQALDMLATCPSHAGNMLGKTQAS